MEQVIVIHYSEIGLKGKNRGNFEAQLKGDIQKRLNRFNLKVKKISGRFLVFGKEFKKYLREVEGILSFVPGVANFAFAYIGSCDLKILAKQVVEVVRKEGWHQQGRFFRVTVVRSDKNLPYTSPQAQKFLGGALLRNFPLQVDIKNYDWVLNVELTQQGAFIYSHKKAGIGGLPVGSSGVLVSLISGGLDSPVASYLMLKRGARLVYVHFHSYPQTSKESIYKVRQIIESLNKFQIESDVYLMSLLPIQKEILIKCPAKLRIVLYRRFMLRLAEKLAGQCGARGIVTGDSLGQVASQTLENMQVISEVVTLPIYRPLIGLDKQEIIELAKKIGTYDISVQPGDDCCSMFLPKNPATKARPLEVREAEKNLDINGLMEKTLKETEKVIIKTAGGLDNK